MSSRPTSLTKLNHINGQYVHADIPQNVESRLLAPDNSRVAAMCSLLYDNTILAMQAILEQLCRCRMGMSDNGGFRRWHCNLRILRQLAHTTLPSQQGFSCIDILSKRYNTRYVYI